MRLATILATLLPCAALAAQDPPGEPAGPAAVTPAVAPQAAPPPAVDALAPDGSAAAAPNPVEAAPAGSAAGAAASSAATGGQPAAAPPPPAEPPWPRLGLFVGAGVPQAATLSLVYRPAPFVRLHAGPSWDYVGFGFHGGVTLSPFRWAVSPTFGVEAGRFPAGDLTKVVSDPDPGVEPLLRDVNVTYLAALLGLEFGSQRGFSFDLRLGLSWLWATARGTGSFTSSGGGVNGGATGDVAVEIVDPTVRATAPTVQLGFKYFF